MISKVQANATADALLRSHSTGTHAQTDKSRKTRSTPMMGLLIGMSFGIVVGCAVCHSLTGRFTPGQVIGQGFGGGLGVLVGLYVDGRTSKRSKLLFGITACTMLVLGALPFALIALMR